MQPLSLFRRLVAVGIETPPGVINETVLGGSRWRWPYLARLLATLVLVPVLVICVLVLPLAQLLGHEVAWGRALAGTLFGAFWGTLVGLALGLGFAITRPPGKASQVLTLGVALGVAGSLQFGAAFGVEDKWLAAVVGGCAFGHVGAAAWASRGELAGGLSFSLGLGIAMSAMFGWPGVVAGALAALRLPLYVVELVWQGVGALLSRGAPSRAAFFLRLAPVFWHELSYFPLPGLRQQILLAAAHEPHLAFRAIAACAIAPGQRQIGLEAATALGSPPTPEP